MRVLHPFEYPDAARGALRKARRLEVLTLAYLVSAVILLYLVMGSSQAMRAAWLEDLLSLLPPLAFLISSYVAERVPTERFPFGFHRAVTIAHLASGLALFFMGTYILYDSAMTLVRAEHPSIGTMTIFGEVVWAGWVMLPVLVWSGGPAVLLGLRKLPLAGTLDNKVLRADADMNKADWTTASAAIAGIVGVGLGLWWADAVAAGIIALDIVWDGTKNVRGAVADLMDQRPVTVERGDHDPAISQVRSYFEDLPWVRSAQLRLREEGELLLGEVFLVPREPEAPDLLRRAAAAAAQAQELDWKIYELTVVLESPEVRADPS